MARTRKSAKSVELTPQPDPRAPLNVAAFLKAAQAVLDTLTKDLLARVDESPEITAALKARHAHEKSRNRTAETYAVWRREQVVQIAASWLLSCVFVRTLEDRGLLARNRLAGPGALDAERAFSQLAPHLGPREYLLTIFSELDHFPAARRLFDREHNLAWRLAPSNEGAKALVGLFRAGDPEQPHFRFGQASTRFLGDLYQDLSEDVRKRYALLQTPDFVEAYILDRTLEPAIEEFGLRFVNVIDPTCGSGHFLLGAFERLFDRWCGAEPGESNERHVELALKGVYGADINPYAVFIAEFRLTLAAIEKLGVGKLREAPQLPMNLVVADSLLHGRSKGQAGFGDLLGQEARVWHGDEFAVEDEGEAKRILGGEYAAVVGNPPYITVKDKALREVYRKRYSSAARKYALSAPFAERFFELARKAGFVGQITSNSFMKREFGKALVQDVLPKLDLFSIVNTSGAYIPGHGTPTVILFGRNCEPVEDKVHAVLARRGEPSTPADPAQGLVWSAIRDHGLEIGYEDEYVTVAEVERATLGEHPWSLEGGGAAELKALLEERADTTLGANADAIGVMALTGEDDIYIREDPQDFLRCKISAASIRPLGIGEILRDWNGSYLASLYLHDDNGSFVTDGTSDTYLWPFRTALKNCIFFGKNKDERGLDWRAWAAVQKDKLKVQTSIAFAFVATHNHFVLDRGGKVFNRTAPIIKLPETATEDDHLALLAYLNSSTACFWMKQVLSDKGATAEKNSERAKTAYEFSGTQLAKLPVPALGEFHGRLAGLASELSRIAAASARLVEECLPFDAVDIAARQLAKRVEAAAVDDAAFLKRMVFLQDELDWLVYEIWRIVPVTTDVDTALANTDEFLPMGSRPSEVFAARSGKQQGIDGHILHELVPQDIPARVRTLVEARVALIGEDDQLRLLEDPLYKRRWWIPRVELGAGRGETFDDRIRAHCETWLRRRIEAFAEPLGTAFSSNQIMQRAKDDVCVAAATAFMGSSSEAFVTAALAEDSVPFVAALRYSDRGLEKHAAWQHTWSLQRQEDAGKKVPEIPVPPKYDQKDFRDATYWRLRGKLDVPKERFISYPGLESDHDHAPIYGWAGWNHAQRAEALLALYNDRKDNEGWSTERLTPILVGIHELLPWIVQWHNEPDEETGERLGDAFRDWLSEELRAHGLTTADLERWRPASQSGRAKPKAAVKKQTGARKTGRTKSSPKSTTDN